MARILPLPSQPFVSNIRFESGMWILSAVPPPPLPGTSQKDLTHYYKLALSACFFPLRSVTERAPPRRMHMPDCYVLSFVRLSTFVRVCVRLLEGWGGFGWGIKEEGGLKL